MEGPGQMPGVGGWPGLKDEEEGDFWRTIAMDIGGVWAMVIDGNLQWTISGISSWPMIPTTTFCCSKPLFG